MLMLMHAFTTTRNVLKIILSLQTPLIAAKFILNDRNYLSCSLRRLLAILLHNLKTNQKLVLQFTRGGGEANEKCKIYSEIKSVDDTVSSSVCTFRY